MMSVLRTVLSLLSMLLLSLTLTVSHAQHTSLKANIYSGLSFFRGSGTSSTTSLASPGDALYAGDRYGNVPGLSYAGELKVERITRHQLIFRMAGGLEHLRPGLKIDSVYGELAAPIAVNGKLTMAYSFLTLSPSVGKRFIIHRFSIDVAAGMDLAFCILAKETHEIQSNENPYFRRYNYNKPDFDARPKIEMSFNYARIGLLIAYSAGLTNYDRDLYSYKEAYINFLRAGLSYRIARLDPKH